MRKRFEQQLSVDIIPIPSVKIPAYKRDELPPTLLALQFIFMDQELNQEVFIILEDAILKGKKKNRLQRNGFMADTCIRNSPHDFRY